VAHVLRIGNNKVTIEEDLSLIVTKFPEVAYLRYGVRFLEARPNFDSESVARAKALGYPDTKTMSVEHEICHTVVAVYSHGQYSRTLVNAALPKNAPEAIPTYAREAEESLVLAIQAYTNLGRLDPWLGVLHLIPRHPALTPVRIKDLLLLYRTWWLK
jgi:hypothetical protein